MSDPGPDPRERHYVTEYTPERETLAFEIVEAVAHASDTDERSLPPLHDSIETDALNRIIHPAPGRQDDAGHAVVIFEYHGTIVTVTRAGLIAVRAPNRS